MNTEERLNLLENEVKALKPKGKDPWDIVQIIAGLLIPASIAFAGYYYARSTKQAEIASNESLANRQELISKTNSRVGQVNVVASFLDSLLSKDPQRQKLAIQAVLIALPDDGPTLVKSLAETGTDQTVTKYANDSLNDRRTTLVTQLFDDHADVRISAATEMTGGGWRSDPKIVEVLLNYARANRANNNGIYNTMVVLNGMDLNAMKLLRDQIEQFSREVESNGDMTKKLSEKLRERLASLG